MSAGPTSVAVVPGSTELPITFPCEGETLSGMLHCPLRSNGCAVLIVVGGPQYRLGSHRQFLLLARRLAAEGCHVLRFDYRGMGDSSGELRGFEHIGPDITAALAALRAYSEDVKTIVGFGLCDAASALLLNPGSAQQMQGLVLLNPWVTEGDADGAVMVKHYYAARLSSPAFWKRLLSGDVKVAAAINGAAGAFAARMKRRGAGASTSAASLSERMASGLAGIDSAVLLITSGQDLTAAEFLERARGSSEWQRQLSSARVRHEHFERANHTFASAAWRGQVEDLIIDWLRDLHGARAG